MFATLTYNRNVLVQNKFFKYIFYTATHHDLQNIAEKVTKTVKSPKTISWQSLNDFTNMPASSKVM